MKKISARIVRGTIEIGECASAPSIRVEFDETIDKKRRIINVSTIADGKMVVDLEILDQVGSAIKLLTEFIEQNAGDGK